MNTKRKVLIAGGQEVIIDDFFVHTRAEYMCMTTSNYMDDIQAHFSLFEPDVYVYCLGKELSSDIETISYSKRCYEKIKNKDEDIWQESNEEQIKENCMVVIIGEKFQIDMLKEDYPRLADLFLVKPISIKKVQAQIEKTFDNWKIQREIAERERKRQEELKQAEEEEQKKIRRRVLVIDDDPTMLRTIKHLLENDYNVATAPSGSVGLRFMSQKDTDLVLLDYDMPDMTGLEVFKIMKDSERTKNIPVVFLTGIAESDKIKGVLEMQPQGYLLKPVDYDRLHQTLRGILKLSWRDL